MKRLVYIFFTLTLALSLSLNAQQRTRPEGGQEEQQRTRPETNQQPQQRTRPDENVQKPKPAPSKPTVRDRTAKTTTGGATIQEQVLNGYVVSLEEVLLGKARKLNADEAEQLFNQGKPLGFMSGDMVYLIINDDYSIASDKLYLHAKADQITVKGETMNNGGMTFIRASDIKSEEPKQ